MTLELTLILTNGCELNKKGCTLLSAPILLEKKSINVLAQLFLRDMFELISFVIQGLQEHSQQTY